MWLSLGCVSFAERFNSWKGLLNWVGINASCKMWLTEVLSVESPPSVVLNMFCRTSGAEDAAAAAKWKVRSRLELSWGGRGVGGCLEQHVRVCPWMKSCWPALQQLGLSVLTEGTVGSFNEYVPFVFNKDDFKLYEFLCLWLTFSVSPRTLQPWEGVFEHKYDSGFMEAACVSIVTHLHYTICLHKLMHCNFLSVLLLLPGTFVRAANLCVTSLQGDVQTHTRVWFPASGGLLHPCFSTSRLRAFLIHCRSSWSKRWATCVSSR